MFRIFSLFLLFSFLYSAQKYAPYDVLEYEEKYKKFMESKKGKKDSKAAKLLDETFLSLRDKYAESAAVLEYLKECCACIRPDCSATRINESYFYPNANILNAVNSVLMDKNTQILNEVELLKKYEYILQSMQTTSIDISAVSKGVAGSNKDSKKSQYGYIKFEWENNGSMESNNIKDSKIIESKTLKITLLPKDDICIPNQYSVVTIFKEEFMESKNTSHSKTLGEESNTTQSPKIGVKTTRYIQKLPSFLYPADLVLFVRESCSCAMALGKIDSNLDSKSAKNALNYGIKTDNFKLDSKILNDKSVEFNSNIESSENSESKQIKEVQNIPKDYYKFLPPNIKYCENLESKREILWEKYTQDPRAIKILQTEHRLHE